MRVPPSLGARIPSLGPRGEGWVFLQLVAMFAVAVTYGAAGEPADDGSVLPLRVLGWLVVGLGGALILGGYLALSGVRSFSIMPMPLPAGELVQSGLYRIVRHPVYAGLIVGGLGLAVIRSSVPTVVATVVLFAILDLKRRREEAWLSARFPGYLAYMGRTKALLPFLY
jgi:protein-S-isoprenylcysteine O-methyltransferase Ste14